MASDSSAVVEALERDAIRGSLGSFASDAGSTNGQIQMRHVARRGQVRLSSMAHLGLGAPTHLSQFATHRSVHEKSAQATLDRAVFDWATFAYSRRRVVALPSSFPASAVCMFSPRIASFLVLNLPDAEDARGRVDCESPLSSSGTATSSSRANGVRSPCTELQSVNAKRLRNRIWVRRRAAGHPNKD